MDVARQQWGIFARTAVVTGLEAGRLKDGGFLAIKRKILRRADLFQQDVMRILNNHHQIFIITRRRKAGRDNVWLVTSEKKEWMCLSKCLSHYFLERETELSMLEHRRQWPVVLKVGGSDPFPFQGCHKKLGPWHLQPGTGCHYLGMKHSGCNPYFPASNPPNPD